MKQKILEKIVLIQSYLTDPQRRKLVSGIVVALLVVAIPLTVFIAQQQQEIRQRAEGLPVTPPTPTNTGVPIPSATPSATPTLSPPTIVDGMLLIAGNVGVGTENPQAILHLDSPTGAVMRLSRTGFPAQFQLDTSGNDGAIYTNTAHPLIFRTNGTEAMRINASQRIGIGTENPTAKLHVNGGKVKITGITENNPALEIPIGSWIYGDGSPIVRRRVMDGNGVVEFANGGLFAFDSGRLALPGPIEISGGKSTWSLKSAQDGFYLRDVHNGADRFVINQSGQIGIGTNNPTAKLEVNGDIRASGKIFGSNIPADYVFEPGYDLKSLKELEEYIGEYQHLPGLPDGSDRKAWEKLSLQDVDAKLLEKIEELTLYSIKQDKINKKQSEFIKALEQRIQKLENE